MSGKANPEIYGKDVNKNSLPNISETVKEKTKELTTYQAVLEDLEKNVVLKQAEIAKQKLRNISYATDANRGAKADYTKLVMSIKDKPGYTAPKNIEDKVFYDIVFRLKELGFAQKIDLSQKVEYNDTLAREVIAFQKLAQLKGQEGVVGPETLKALLEGKASTTTVLGQNVAKNQIGQEITDETTASTNQNTENIIGSEAEEEKLDISKKIIKKFEVAAALSNTTDNISEEELEAFQKLDNKINKGDILYMEFEKILITNVDKILASDQTKTLADNGETSSKKVSHENVSELLRNYSEGYLEDNTKEQKDIELDPNFFFALRDTIVKFLFDPQKTKDQKQRLIYFIRSFTNNFNDILQNCESELQKSMLSMIAPQLLS